MPHLLHHQSDAPVARLELGRDLLQFAWCPDTSSSDSTCSYLALTSDRVLLHGSLVSGSAALADGVECAAWSPDGQHIAYSSGSRLTVTAPDWKDSAFTVNIPPPEGEDGDGDFVLDGLAWPAPRTLAASALWYEPDTEDEPESTDAYLLALTWQAWAGEAAAAPSGLEARLTSYVTLQVREYDGWDALRRQQELL
eukprot:GHRQ01014869.1.p2 GENE.GHRQ01014869.1~~GHRQ01014869.1.p2  ORF type:complete len:196 (+),score=77.82 GHRQ01014869.1:1957-2544(+)